MIKNLHSKVNSNIILKYKETAVLCLGDLNSPGNSAKFDSPWGKIISLDFKSGEPIASNLFSLYDYCRRSVIDDYRHLKTDGIKSSVEVISDILSAWNEIKQK